MSSNGFRALWWLAVGMVSAPWLTSGSEAAEDSDLYATQLNELRAVKKRLVAEMTLAGVPADSPMLAEHIGWLDERADELLAVDGGYWSRYTDIKHPEISHNGGAFYWVRLLATAWLTPASKHYQDGRLLAAVESGLRHLLTFAHPDLPKRPLGNWWAWDIGIPTHLLLTLILLEGRLDPALFDKEAATAVHLLRADGSYKFHGHCPMWAYGRRFVFEYGRLVWRWRGTQFGPRPEQLDRYAEMAEQFVNGFLYHGRICPAMIGREISRRERSHYNPLVLSSLAVLARSQHSRAPVFAGLLARERGYVADAARDAGLMAVHLQGAPQADPAPPVNDLFAYPDSDFMQVTRPGWAAGLKMHSARNKGYESINRENLQGWFLSHGSMFHYIDGDEWDACWSTIDWTRLPGTTVAVEVKGRNASPFAGVLRASSQVGLAAQEIRCDEFRARKSWLIKGDHVICLGSDIAGPGRVETTVINQPVADDAVLLIEGKPAPAGGFHITRKVRWLWLDNGGYVFPAGADLLILRESRRSNWNAIRSERMYGKGEPVTHWYVTAVISHGPGSASYAYLFLPGTPRDQMPERVRSLRGRYTFEYARSHHVLSADDELESIVMWEADRMGGVEADRGSMMLRTGRNWQLVDPAWKQGPLRIDVAGEKRELTPARGRPVRF